MLYRVFPHVPETRADHPGGALFVPRFDQGGGRHDNPEAYGALYLSRGRVAPVAEHLRALQARIIGDRHLVRDGGRLSLATLEDADVGDLLDLDEPANLVERSLRPSAVATADRDVTQPMALAIYEDGVPGFEWWSTIEASWINVTLFEDRVAERLEVVGEPEPLTLDHPAVREAAEAVGVLLG